MTDATGWDEAAMRKAAERSLSGGDWWDPHDLREALDRIADVGDDTRADADYIWQVRPAKVLAALDEITRLRAALDEARADLAAETSRADDLNREVITCDRLDLLARTEAAEQERDEARAEAARHYAAFVGSEAALARAESALAAARALDFDVSLGDVLSVMPKCHKRGCYCNGTGDGEPRHVVIAVANAYRAAIGQLLAVLPAPTSPERSDG